MNVFSMIKFIKHDKAFYETSRSYRDQELALALGRLKNEALSAEERETLINSIKEYMKVGAEADDAWAKYQNAKGKFQGTIEVVKSAAVVSGLCYGGMFILRKLSK